MDVCVYKRRTLEKSYLSTKSKFYREHVTQYLKHNKKKFKLNKLELSIIGYNLFNSTYVETGIVPMPKGNILFGLKTIL